MSITYPAYLQSIEPVLTAHSCPANTLRQSITRSSAQSSRGFVFLLNNLTQPATSIMCWAQSHNLKAKKCMSNVYHMSCACPLTWTSAHSTCLWRKLTSSKHHKLNRWESCSAIFFQNNLTQPATSIMCWAQSQNLKAKKCTSNVYDMSCACPLTWTSANSTCLWRKLTSSKHHKLNRWESCSAIIFPHNLSQLATSITCCAQTYNL